MTVGLVAVNFGIVGYLQPLALYDYQQLNYQLQSGALGASIKIGEFTALEDRVALRVERSEEDGRRLMGIFARISDPKGQVLSISAREGRFMANREDRNTIILRLTDGTIVQDQPGETPRVLGFSQQDLPIDLPAIERFRKRGDETKEYLLPELLKMGWSKQATPIERDAGQSMFSYKMVEVVMMFMLPLMAVALAIPPKRSTSALGVFVSIIMVVSYHKVNQYGQQISALGRVDPLMALWGPFLVFAAFIGWMYYRVAYVPGGQAIGALETSYAKLTRRLRKLLRRGRNRDQDDDALIDDSPITNSGAAAVAV
jgi:lipopolysaccharide export system permease protein